MTPEQLQQLIEEHIHISAEIAALTARLDAITDQLRKLPEGKHPTSAGVVTVTPPVRRFSPSLAAQILPEHLVAACSEQTIVAAKAKQMLPPALYAQCSAPAASAKPGVRVKAA